MDLNDWVSQLPAKYFRQEQFAINIFPPNEPAPFQVLAPPVNSDAPDIKNVFLQSLGKNPTVSPPLSQVPDIMDEFVNSGRPWTTVRDHHESFNKRHALKLSNSSVNPNIIGRYLNPTPGNVLFIYFILFAF